MQIRLIFSPVITRQQPHSTLPIYLYGEFFRFSPQYQETVAGINVFAPAPGIDMFELHRHRRANGNPMAEIVRLTDVREFVQLVPVYGHIMDNRLNCDNSLDLSEKFYLNNFASKDTFHAILSYQ